MINKFKIKFFQKLELYNSLFGNLKDIISYKFISGNGIEIGALHNPQKINILNTRVKYVDRISKSDLRLHYPELNNLKLVNVDIIDNGESLESIENNSLDFIIANHMLEHCIDPIKTIEVFINRLKRGGKIFLTIPDKRFTFDFNRQLTDFEHLKADYKSAKLEEQIHHYIEWVRASDEYSNLDELAIKEIAENLLRDKYSIHFHVWDCEGFLDFIINTNKLLKNIFKVEAFLFNSNEIIVVLSKT